MKKRLSRFDRELKKTEFRVTIFGSARVKRGDKTYKLIYDLAKRIGEQDMDIVTGGGPGLMEAASVGHRKGQKKGGKSHTLGLLIKLASMEKHNNHLDIKREFSRFSQRLDTFMSLSNAVVVSPGGLGTLLEFFYTWQLIQLKQICDIPIILVGDHYKQLIDWVKKGPLKNHYLTEADMHPIFFATNAKQAMKIILKAHESYKQGGRNVCLNIRKYRIN